MTDKTYTTGSGKTLTDADIEQLADEAATTDYDVEALKPRRRGRPLIGSAPAEVVPVRLDPELRALRSKHARPPIRPRPATSSEKLCAASSTSPERSSRRTEFGRTGREKDGKHRSPTVTHGQQRTLENRP